MLKYCQFVYPKFPHAIPMEPRVPPLFYKIFCLVKISNLNTCIILCSSHTTPIATSLYLWWGLLYATSVWGVCVNHVFYAWIVKKSSSRGHQFKWHGCHTGVVCDDQRMNSTGIQVLELQNIHNEGFWQDFIRIKSRLVFIQQTVHSQSGAPISCNFQWIS